MRRACSRVLKRGLACVRVVWRVTHTDGASFFFDSIVVGRMVYLGNEKLKT
jgi:hypothetical protein